MLNLLIGFGIGTTITFIGMAILSAGQYDKGFSDARSLYKSIK